MRERMLTSVFARTLRDQRRALLGFGLGLVAFSLFIAAFWPTVRDQQAQFEQLMDAYPPAMREMFGISDLASPGGFVHAELFSVMTPILFLVYAIGRAAGSTAGDEESGALDVLLAHPISRRRAMLQKMGGLAAGLFVLAALLYGALMVGSLAIGMGLGAGALAAECLLLLLLAYAMAGITFLLAALRGRRGLAIGVASAIAAGGYLLHSFGAIVDALATVRKVSPFYYYGASPPLAAGFEPLHALVLAAIALVAGGLAVWAFDRRDVGV